MFDRYDPAAFEAKWRDRWEAADLFVTRTDADRQKFYALDFFPYPSGAGLSVGHCKNYIPTDVLARYKFMRGYNVLHPMGFDAFGLPAENEAIKNKTHPAPMIDRYAATYRRQMTLVGVSYDWSRSFKSSDPSYYKWTQWIFKKLYERGLAYRKMASVNWDPVDKTVLADEEVIAGRAERSGALVEKKLIPQWFFRITEYAQRLIDDLDDLDWPEGIKHQQKNWIGRSEGVEFEIKLDLQSSSVKEGGFVIANQGTQPTFRVFTTRIDTLFGVTFCVLAPEHPVVDTLMSLVDQEHREAIEGYRQAAKLKTDTERTLETKTKTGVFTGAYAINPGNGKRVPLWIADYVLMNYGTGAIMAVPGHDQRDFEFAMQFGLDVIPVIQPTEEYLRGFAGADDASYEELLANYTANPKSYDPVFLSKDAVLMNSGEYDGLTVAESQKLLGEWMEGLGIGERKVQYKLRDWLISRQRYWGCPIPVLYDAEGDEELVPDDCLPVLLPDVESYEPTGDGASPLARINDFVNVSDSQGRLGKRETDTMGGFACSSWYFLRFCDPHNENQAFDPEIIKQWMPVDCYVGGAEHAVMHLLYARFWTKVLYDMGICPVKEPFHRLMNQGQVLARTPYRLPREGETLAMGEEGVLISFAEAEKLPEDQKFYRWSRMSKSKGNVVTPDEAVEQYGADALRVYELFVAPFEADVQWSNEGMNGAVRFLSRIFKLVSTLAPHFDSGWRSHLVAPIEGETAVEMRRATHKVIQKATDDIERFAQNTYISALMIYVNTLTDLSKSISVPRQSEVVAISEALESLITILSPVAPHSADELWESLGQQGFVYHKDWPSYEPALTVDDEVTIAVQVNGKLRDNVTIAASASNEDCERAALASPKVQAHLEGKTIRKVVVVPGRLVNVVAN